MDAVGHFSRVKQSINWKYDGQVPHISKQGDPVLVRMNALN